jgi:hypothetical protein
VHIVPVHPRDLVEVAADAQEPAGPAEPVPFTAVRRSFGRIKPPSRRTLGRIRPPSRRTLGRTRPPSRRTLGRWTSSRRH